MAASTAADAWSALALRDPAPLPVFLPLVVLPDGPRRRAVAMDVELRDVIRRHLSRVGAIVLRGFGLREDHDFERLVAAAEPEPAPGHLWAWCAVSERSQAVELAELTGALLEVDAQGPPGWRVMHADGSPLEGRDAERMNAALEAHRVLLSWNAGDVLLLDSASATALALGSL